MANERIEHTLVVRFRDRGPAVVRDADKKTKEQALEEAIREVLSTNPKLKDLEVIGCNYTAIPLGPVVTARDQHQRTKE